ncbi:MAG: ATP-dependent DNA helicase [Thermoproteota archaeon]|nr:ATP-dependent DNA helicase [Thermoproteota archaeon]
MDPLHYFPYKTFREGQKELIFKIFEAINNSKILFVQAPSGFGKTISLLTACLPFLEEENSMVIYVVRTYRQIDRVLEELEKINNVKNVRISILKAKSEMCINEKIEEKIKKSNSFNFICREMISNGSCYYYKNYYEKQIKINQIINLKSKQSFKYLYDLSSNLNICLYEFNKSLLLDSNFILMTYSSFFTPEAFSIIEEKTNRHTRRILIADEAHNIPELLSNIHSVSMNIDLLLKNSNELLLPIIEKLCDIINKKISDKIFLKLTKEEILNIIISEYNISLVSILKELRRNIYINPNNFNLIYFYNFLKSILELNENSYIIYVDRNIYNDLILNLSVIDPSYYSKELFMKFNSIILASATLEPIDSYKYLLGLEDLKEEKIVLSSKYPNIKSIFITNVTTKFEERSNELYSKIIDVIEEVSLVANGGVAIFVSSYDVMKGLLNAGIQFRIKKDFLIENKEMNDEEVENMLQIFKENPNSKILLAVQGGKISEGEDFPSNTIKFLFLVGIPFEQPSPVLKEKISYFENRWLNKGIDFAFVIPALRKSIQSVGRALREEKSTIYVIFLDKRFLYRRVFKYIPEWLKREMHVLSYSKGKLRRILNQ